MFAYAKEIGDDPIKFAKMISTANVKYLEALNEDKEI